MKAYLTRRYLFSASHRLHAATMSDEENRATYGKCNNPYGHGHNYQLEVTVSGQVELRTGMICDLVELDRYVEENVLCRYEHQNLNSLDEFRKLVPTTENLCVRIYHSLQRFRAAKVEQVRIEETMLNSFTYAGDAAALM